MLINTKLTSKQQTTDQAVILQPGRNAAVCFACTAGSQNIVWHRTMKHNTPLDRVPTSGIWLERSALRSLVATLSTLATFMAFEGNRRPHRHESLVIFAVWLLVWGVGTCSGRSLLVDPGPSSADLYIAPVGFNHSLIGPLGGVKQDPYWFAAQWLNSRPFDGDFSRGTQGPCVFEGGAPPLWFANVSSGHICRFKHEQTAVIELSQNGVTPSIPCGNEFDMFLSPVTPIYRGYAPGINASNNLGALRYLNLTLDVQQISSNVQERCGSGKQCGGSGEVDYGYSVAALTLHNLYARRLCFCDLEFYPPATASKPKA